MNEEAVKSHVRLASSQLDCTLWRNNSGVLENRDGTPVRYGLANESNKMNEVFKSSDFIGLTRHLITPADVGQVVGVFTAVETKASDWVFRQSDKRAVAQKAFIDFVLMNGGYAGFAQNVEEFRRILRC